MKYLIFIIILVSIHSVHAQKHLILIGRLAQKDYSSSISIEYDFKIGKRQKIFLVLNNTDNHKSSTPKNFVSSTVITENGSLNNEYFFTTPSATSISLGLKQKLNKHKKIDFYFAPELSIIHTGKHTSYKKEKKLISVTEPTYSDMGWFGLFFFFLGASGTTYTIDETVKIANVPDTYHYYLNCKSGMSIYYHQFILDFNFGFGRKLDSNLKFKKYNNDVVGGYQASNITFYTGLNLGYQF